MLTYSSPCASARATPASTTRSLVNGVRITSPTKAYSISLLRKPYAHMRTLLMVCCPAKMPRATTHRQETERGYVDSANGLRHRQEAGSKLASRGGDAAGRSGPGPHRTRERSVGPRRRGVADDEFPSFPPRHAGRCRRRRGRGSRQCDRKSTRLNS